MYYIPKVLKDFRLAVQIGTRITLMMTKLSKEDLDCALDWFARLVCKTCAVRVRRHNI
jgi:hypothetical protein